MQEARIPAEFVEPRRPTAISDVARRKKCMQHEHGGRAPAPRAVKEICASNVVGRKVGVDGTAPRDRRAVADPARESAIGRNCVKIVRSEFLTFLYIALHFFAAARVQSMP